MSLWVAQQVGTRQVDNYFQAWGKDNRRRVATAAAGGHAPFRFCNHRHPSLAAAEACAQLFFEAPWEVLYEDA